MPKMNKKMEQRKQKTKQIEQEREEMGIPRFLTANSHEIDAWLLCGACFDTYFLLYYATCRNILACLRALENGCVFLPINFWSGLINCVARLRSPREGLAERRVTDSESCKGTRNGDWTCAACGKVTFRSKKTDQCYYCKTVRNKIWLLEYEVVL